MTIPGKDIREGACKNPAVSEGVKVGLIMTFILVGSTRVQTAAELAVSRW